MVASLMPEDWNMGRALFTCGGSETNDTDFKIVEKLHELPFIKKPPPMSRYGVAIMELKSHIQL